VILQIASWIIGLAGIATAFACAAADACLLVSHVAETTSAWDVEFAERERQHRALSMARVLAYVIAGAVFAQGLRLSESAAGTRVLAALSERRKPWANTAPAIT